MILILSSLSFINLGSDKSELPGGFDVFPPIFTLTLWSWCDWSSVWSAGPSGEGVYSVSVRRAARTWAMKRSLHAASTDVCAIWCWRAGGAQLSALILSPQFQSRLSDMFYDESTYFFSPGGHTLLGSTRSLPPFPVGSNSFQVRGVPQPSPGNAY